MSASPPAPVERRLFWVCVAVIVAHALLASLVFVRPGAARSDHLLAALVPTAVVGLTAVFYSRLPAGARASAALLFGVFSLVGGGVALAGLLTGGAIAHGALGVLLLPAGAVLAALGVRLLWTSRKRGGPLWWTVTRRALLAVAGLLVLYWAVVPVALAIVATQRPREDMPAADVGRRVEDVVLHTADGVEVHAWYVSSRNGAAVVTLPRTWTQRQARLLADAGYGVLLLDLRGYGDSEGDPNAYGWGSTREIDAAVAWLQGRPDVQGRIGGLGLSVGAEQMLEAAASNQNLKAIVCEGAGIRSVREALVRRGPSPVELALQYPADVMQTAAVWVLSGQTPPRSLLEAAAALAPRAALFVYGENGQAVEETVAVPYAEAAGDNAQLWEVPGAGHTGGLAAQPEEYGRRVVAFFDRYLLGAE